MSHYKSYPTYKATGVEWLGEVPEHWVVSPMKWAIERNDGGVWGDDPSGDSDTIVLRSTEQTVDGNWRIDEPASRKLSESDKEFALLKAGDLLVTKSSGSSLHIGKTTLVTPEIEGMQCCYSNFMQRIRTKQDIRPKLAWYIMNNDLAREQFDYLSNTTTGLANLNGTMIGSVLIAIPPDEEQKAIVAALDHETARIDALVEKKTCFIELLREKRQALITHAVTKGLDPKVKMKNSGVQWLGEVPAHWIVTPLQYVIAAIEQGWSPDCLTEPAELDEWGVVKSGCVNGGVFSAKENKKLPPDLEARPEIAIKPGDVLMSRASGSPDLIGSVGLVGEFSGNLMLSDKIFRIITNNKIDKKFFVCVMSSSMMRTQIVNAISGAEGLANNLPQSRMKKFLMALPRIEEQIEVVNFIEKSVSRLDSLICKSEQSIELLKERRFALITAAVTGQIDLREAA